MSAWQPIEIGPLDGSAVLLANRDGAWVGKYYPIFTSGYRPENPWATLMLNHEHMDRNASRRPTHWQPIPDTKEIL